MLTDETTVVRLKRQHPESLRTTRLRAPKKSILAWNASWGHREQPPTNLSTRRISVHIETATVLASLSKKSGSFVAFAFHFCWPYLMQYFLCSFFAHLRASWWLHLLGHIWPGPPASPNISEFTTTPAARVMCRWRQRVIHGFHGCVHHRGLVRLSGRSSPSGVASSPHGHTSDKRDTSRRCGTCNGVSNGQTMAIEKFEVYE